MSKKGYDGMRYPSVDLLLDEIDSKYKLAYAAAKSHETYGGGIGSPVLTLS